MEIKLASLLRYQIYFGPASRTPGFSFSERNSGSPLNRFAGIERRRAEHDRSVNAHGSMGKAVVDQRDPMGGVEALFHRSGADGERRLRIVVVRAENAFFGLGGRHPYDRNRGSDGPQEIWLGVIRCLSNTPAIAYFGDESSGCRELHFATAGWRPTDAVLPSITIRP